jgi:hypothetical protein
LRERKSDDGDGGEGGAVFYREHVTRKISRTSGMILKPRRGTRSAKKERRFDGTEEWKTSF